MEDIAKVTVKFFLAGNYYGRRIPNWGGGFAYGPHVIRLEHRMLVRSGKPFAVVGHVEMDADKFNLGSFGGVLEMGHGIADFVRTKKNAAAFRLELLPLSDLLKR